MELAKELDNGNFEMVSSGLDWIGAIPKEWKLLKGNYAFKVINDRSRTGNERLLSVSEHNGVRPREETNVNMFMAESYKGYKLCKEGDLVINSLWAWSRGLGISKYNGIVSTAYSVYRPNHKNYDKRYLNYLLRTERYVAQYLIASKGIWISRLQLSDWAFLRIPILSPSKPEQTIIANFLDDRTSKIDQAIVQKERLIELLRERKQIIIQNVVTKGLDQKVKLKDSGIEWIGKIPEHWSQKRFRYVFSLGKGLTITKENLIEEGVYCVNYGEIHSKYGFEVNPVRDELKCVEYDYLKSNKSALIKNGDFVFADTSEDIEGSGNFTCLRYDKEIFAGYHTVIARPKMKINSRFFAYQFDSVPFRNQIRCKVKGVKVYSITQNLLKEPTVWIPPIEEQEKIVEYLDEKIQSIESAIVLKNREIKKLAEYKATLIDNAVTGKIKVS